MDLQALEADLGELEKKFRERNGLFWDLSKETMQKVGHDGYTREDRERELEALDSQLDAIYDSRHSIRPVLDMVIRVYPEMSAEDRAAVREIFHVANCGSYGLLDYIYECAECLETPDDADVFRLALIAASIQNCALDFRDTHAILAELAVSAVQAGIEMEPDCAAIAELSSAEPSTGGCQPMKTILAGFPKYAPTAIRLF